MRVLVTGCFDILHPGHIHLLKEAAKLGEVFVIIARDSTIERYKKVKPIIPEQQRLDVIKSIKYVSDAVLGTEANGDHGYLQFALTLKPDIIFLGPNQRTSVSYLKKGLEECHSEHVQVKRLEKIYDKFELNSSSAIKEKIKNNLSYNTKRSDKEKIDDS